MPPRVRIGIVGWNYPEWRGLVYTSGAKPAELLQQYAMRFPIVEAASSYYGMPKTEVVATWAAQTPSDFEISLKVPDWILKKKPDDPDLPRVLDVFMAHMAALRDVGKLGTIVAQFSPFFKREKKADELAGFVAALPKGPRWAVELRDASWWHDDTYRLLRDAGVTLVWSALGEGFRTPPVATTSSLYLRLFGDRELEEPFNKKRRDAREELAHWVERIQKPPPGVERIDVLVSKYLEGYAPGTAETLAQMLGIPLRAPTTAPRSGQTTLPFE